MIYLRPHHLLCIQNYIGKGYDESFTKKMDLVTACLKNDPEQKIMITEMCDDLCASCPNKEEGRCVSPDKTDRLDQMTAQILGFRNGEEVSWKTAAGKADERILKTASFWTICRDCSWFELCRRTVSNNNK